MLRHLVLTIVVLHAAAAQAAVRHAVVIANNTGFADEPVLRFAESDGELVLKTLYELGAVAPEHTHRLFGGSLSSVRALLERVVAKVGQDDEVMLFVSGHAGAAGLHYGAELWRWSELRRLVDTMRARRVIAFVDACHSGALVTPKGLTLGPPLKVSLSSSVSGRWILTSSGSNELSYESRRLAGSPFVHSVLTGLRGAADANGDLRVTVDELYAFTYVRTLTEALHDGAEQRPGRSTETKGIGEWSLVELGRDLARLAVTQEVLGRCYVLDEQERKVIAEVSTGQSVALAPGRYRLKCIGESMRVALLEVSPRDSVKAEALRFESRPLGATLAKGPSPKLVHRFGLRISVEPLGELAPSLGVSYGILRDGLGADLDLRRSSRMGWSGLVGIASPLPWWRTTRTTLELGIHAGATLGAAPSDAAFMRLGQHSQLWVGLGDGWRALVRLEVGTRIAVRPPLPPSSTLTLVVGATYESF